MKYCQTTTKLHPISLSNKSCLEQIDQIITREGGNPRLFGSMHIGLNLDMVERNNRPHQMRSTVDFCFGISQNLKNKQIILTELRFRVNNPKTIKKTDIIGKIDGSIELLSRDIPIYNRYFFIFNDNQKEVARSHFRLLFNNKPNNPYTPLKLNELHELFFSNS